MKRPGISALTATILLYLALMYVPFQRYAFWGMDEGEYIAITKNIVARGLILPDYNGWTQGYPYFQGYFASTAAFSSISGISVHYSMWALVFSSFISIIFIFLIAKRFMGIRAAILSAVFLAVIMPFVYQNSHPAPESLGHVLFMATLLAFWTIEKRADLRMRIFPHILALALIFTHPMSSYILLLSLGMMYLYRLYRGRERGTLLYFLIEYTVFLILYWGWVAYPFIGPATGIPQYLFLAGTVLIIPIFILLEVIISPHEESKNAIPGTGKQAYPVIIGFVATALILAYMLIFSVPGTGEPVRPYAIAFYIPLILLSISSLSGIYLIKMHRTGMDNLMILLAIGISALLGWLTGSDMLIPFRHMEYMVIPMALMFGIGMTMFILRTKPSYSRALAGGVAVLLLGSALTCYPPPQALQNFTEGTEWNEVPSVLVASEMNGSITTDHRLSSVLASFGQENVSWDDARSFFEDPHNSSYPAETVLVTNRMSEYAVFSWKDSTLSIDEEPFNSYYMLYSDGEGRIYLFTPASS